MAERKELKPGQKVLIVCTLPALRQLFGEETFLKEFKYFPNSLDMGNSPSPGSFWETSPPFYHPTKPKSAMVWRSRDLFPLDDPDIDAQLRQERHELNTPLVRSDVPNPFLV